MAFIEDGIELQKAEISENKKTVFLIGDSIRIGYSETVKAELADVANVIWPAENCRNSQYILTTLRTWATITDPATVDLVLFNCGQWDLAHFEGDAYNLTDIDTYALNIGRIIWRLHKHFPNAKIHFATCSSMNPDGIIGRNPRTNEEVKAYNAAACRAVQKEGVPVCDIFAFTETLSGADFVDHCHPTKEAFASLGKYVAAYLRKALV